MNPLSRNDPAKAIDFAKFDSGLAPLTATSLPTSIRNEIVNASGFLEIIHKTILSDGGNSDNLSLALSLYPTFFD